MISSDERRDPTMIAPREIAYPTGSPIESPPCQHAAGGAERRERLHEAAHHPAIQRMIDEHARLVYRVAYSALRNWADVKEYASVVYARPDYIQTLATSTAIADHVAVDFELRGCPISKRQLLEVISAMLAGRRPVTPPHSVCIECKLKGNVCVMVAHGTPCLGPVTHAGCGAICPSYNRGCYGCYGPMETPNTLSLSDGLHKLGMDERGLMQVYRTFNANAGPFREESDRHDG